MEPTVHSISIPSSTQHLEKVRRFVKSSAVDAGLSRQAIADVQMAVDEACANVIEHAYNGDESNLVDVEVRVEPDSFVVSIQDRGIAFNLETYNEPNVPSLVEQRKRGGLGVYLITKLMDKVEYRKRGRRNEVRLIKHLKGC